ncbi:DUF5123 domain-containing protein [Pedobacter hiemivivus]|nr:DUF5123 domain-containing protein [Pedobacter hiemivivus]
MKNMFKNYILIAVSVAIVSGLISCKKSEDLGKVPRLFRPVIKGALLAPSNYIEGSWQKMSEAKGYIAQISRDTFRTIDKSVNLDSNNVVFEELLWEQLYQIQIIAVAPDPSKNSKPSFLGEIKTPRFPTILALPSLSDVTESAVKLRWTNSGDAVTSVKVLLASNSSELKQINLTAQNISNQFLDITGLEPSTAYIVYLYSGTKVRGWNNYTTKAPLTGIIIDLRAIDLSVKTQILTDTIPDIPSGSTIILRRGSTYNVPAAIALNKSIKLVSGSDLSITSNAAVTIAGSFFSFTAGSNIDYLDFENVNIKGLVGGYALNVNTACNIGRISFEGCYLDTFRGLVRMQTATNSITNLSINNCIVSNVLDYGLLNVNAAINKVDNLSLTNSTVYACEKLFTSKQNTISVSINDNTFHQTPLSGSYYLDYNGFTISGITSVKNNIFSIGKGTGSPPVTTVNGKRGTMNLSTSNNYSTSDFGWATATTAFTDVTAHIRPSADLFTDPSTGNFMIKDAGFAGKSTAGDPRWRLK